MRIVQGTPLDKDDVKKAFLAMDNNLPEAVIITLNATRTSDSPFAKPLAPPRFMADSVANVREVMVVHGVKKLVIMSAVGVGDSWRQLNFFMKPIISYTNMSAQYKDHNLVDIETKESGLDWVIVRPVMLKEGDALPLKIYGNTGENSGFMPSITRGSVANFLVDAVERDEWNRSTPVITN